MKIEYTLFVMAFMMSMAGCSNAENSAYKDDSAVSRSDNALIIGKKAPGEAVAKAIEKASVAWDPIHEGTTYYEQGNYKLAIQKYTEAIKVCSNKGQEWVARSGLGEAYEADGDYKMALETIAWQFAHNRRPDVRAKLTIRKQRLEKLLAEKK